MQHLQTWMCDRSPKLTYISGLIIFSTQPMFILSSVQILKPKCKRWSQSLPIHFPLEPHIQSYMKSCQFHSKCMNFSPFPSSLFVTQLPYHLSCTDATSSYNPTFIFILFTIYITARVIFQSENLSMSPYCKNLKLISVL